MVVINFAIIITDSHRGSPCYGIMSNSSYRWINRSSVRISGFSKITELISDGDKIWTPVCPAPNSDSIFLTPLGGSRWCLHQHCSQELTDMCSPRVQGTCYYSSSHPNSKGHSQGQSAAWEHQIQGQAHFAGVSIQPRAFLSLGRSLEGPRLHFENPSLKLAYLSTQSLFFNWKLSTS